MDDTEICVCFLLSKLQDEVRRERSLRLKKKALKTISSRAGNTNWGRLVDKSAERSQMV
jgi:hypothetical protein